jgi:hypothetical protein
MARRAGMYSMNKRKKELARKKKQDEKRLRRQKNAKVLPQELEGTEEMNVESAPSEDKPESTDE